MPMMITSFLLFIVEPVYLSIHASLAPASFLLKNTKIQNVNFLYTGRHVYFH